MSWSGSYLGISYIFTSDIISLSPFTRDFNFLISVREFDQLKVLSQEVVVVKVVVVVVGVEMVVVVVVDVVVVVVVVVMVVSPICVMLDGNIVMYWRL